MREDKHDFDHPRDAFVLKDSGVREAFPTGSVRDTREGKGRFDLIPPMALRRLAAVYEKGAAKYGEDNWQKGQPLSRFLDSAMRHTTAVLEGLEDEDHVFQAVWNLIAYAWTKENVNATPTPVLDTGLGTVRPLVPAALGIHKLGCECTRCTATPPSLRIPYTER